MPKLAVLPELPVHYRFVDLMYEDGIHVVVQKFYPVNETPCFYYVVNEFEEHMLSRCPTRKPLVKKVSKDGLRRHCYPSKELALASYKKRKASQLTHCKRGMETAILTLESLKDLTTIEDNINLGKTDSYNGLVFD